MAPAHFQICLKIGFPVITIPGGFYGGMRSQGFGGLLSTPKIVLSGMAVLTDPVSIADPVNLPVKKYPIVWRTAGFWELPFSLPKQHMNLLISPNWKTIGRLFSSSTEQQAAGKDYQKSLSKAHTPGKKSKGDLECALLTDCAGMASPG